MGFKPIPKKDLPHTASLIHFPTAEEWETPTSVKITLTFVRIAGSSAIKYNENGTEMSCSKKLYFDGFFSLPKNTVFQVGDHIEDEMGEEFTIKAVNPVYTDAREDKIHHWEVGLV